MFALYFSLIKFSELQMIFFSLTGTSCNQRCFEQIFNKENANNLKLA